MRQFATEQDFKDKRKFCGFRIVIEHTCLKVEECGEVEITQDKRNKELRILWSGSISHGALKELRMQSSSFGSFSGYYVDYAENREDARKQACVAAITQHKKMIGALSDMLENMKSLELTLVNSK